MSGFPFSFITDQLFHVNTDQSVNTDMITNSADNALFELLDGLSIGETILGKIVSSDINSYTFKTENGLLVNAKAQNGVSLEPGSSVLFEVNKTSSDSFSLRPLNMNTNTKNTAEVALKEAGIPVNNRSLEMTVRNMEYGNPIDKRSLIESYKNVALNEDIPVKYIVDLEYMNIPVSKENLSQYENYLKMGNAVANNLSKMSNSLSLDICKDLFIDNKDSLFASENDKGTSEALVKTMGSAEITSFSLSSNASVSLMDSFFGSESVFDINNLDEIINDNNPVKVLRDVCMNLDDLSVYVEANDIDTLDVFTSLKNEIGKLSSAINDNKDLLKDIQRNDAFISAPLVTSQAEESQISALIKGLLSDGNIRKGLTEKVKNIIDKTIIKNSVLDRTVLGDKGEIKDLYERLYSDTKKLMNAFSDISNKGSETVSLLNNLNNNIEFMNALNNYVPYVQIPFKGLNGNKSGELYVFKNKRGGSLEDELTAFIHLDTDNLGSTDVFVALKGDNVSTHFTLQNEESLKLVEDNLSFLNNRLSKKGYTFKGDVRLEESFKSPIERMMESNSSKIKIANTSFDARI